ncbi:MAG: hypothetical protein RLZZ301_341 [Bacteroidota bacterium]|jgi:GMP synthase (glutamine-hydrolysing)
MTLGIIDCGSQKTPALIDCIDSLCDYQLIGLNDIHLETALQLDGLIFSGAPLLWTEQNLLALLDQFAWLCDYPKPILGICFGHQLLGQCYGARVARMRDDRDWQEIEIVTADRLFERLPDCFDMREDHCEHISIAPNFVQLACSDACSNEAMKHRDKAHYGVQFHPEVSGNTGYTLLENFVWIVEDQLLTRNGE